MAALQNFRVVVGWVTLVLPISGQSAGTITYTIRPRPSPERTVLEVSMHLTGDADGETRLVLPRCRFGTPEMHESVTELWVDLAQDVECTGKGPERILQHGPSAPLHVRYSLDWDPGSAMQSAYRPDVGPDHFHFFGEQWRIRVVEREETTFEVVVADVPEAWTVFSSMGPGTGPWRAKARDEDFAPLIAGGSYLTKTITLAETPVTIGVGGAFAQRDEIMLDVERTARLLTGHFGNFPPAAYTIAVTGRGKYRAGVAIDGAFVCLTDPGMDRTDLLKLIAHETLHVWLSGAGTIREWKLRGIDEFRFDWFVEGFTEYCARRLLLDEGLITTADFVEAFNRDLRELARNPQRNASLEAVATAMQNSAYTNRHERLSYLRGPLLAVVWEAESRKPMPEIVRAVVRSASATGGAIGEEAFFDLLEHAGLPARLDYSRYIVKGADLILPPDLFGPDHEFTEIELSGEQSGGDAVKAMQYVRKQ